MTLTHHLFVLLTLTVMMAVTASHLSPRRYNLINRLEAQKVDVNELGCKCIMSSPSSQNTDSTLCLCFNRDDGTLNDSSKCRLYTDTVFTFCTDVTDKTNLWQKCVKHYCPADSKDEKKPPKNQILF